MDTDRKYEPRTVEANHPADDPLTIPVHQEELRIGTKQVDTGRGVRVEKAVVEHPQIIEEILREEEVRIDRIPVNRILAAGEVPDRRYEGNTLIVPVLEEVLVVEKRWRIKEELHITKAVREKRRTESVPLKSEQVSIERFDERGRS